jgi:hypothetical protein
MSSPSKPRHSSASHGHRVPTRESISSKRRKRALDLEQSLRFLQDQYNEPSFFEVLQDAIAAIHAQAERSRSSDRDRVLGVIEQWESLTRDEITEETDLSAWVVRNILKELIELNLIGSRTQSRTVRIDGGRPLRLYFLTHKNPSVLP